jgi:hypothetical protein
MIRGIARSSEESTIDNSPGDGSPRDGSVVETLCRSGIEVFNVMVYEGQPKSDLCAYARGRNLNHSVDSLLVDERWSLRQ